MKPDREPDAVRRQTHDTRRVQGPRRRRSASKALPSLWVSGFRSSTRPEEVPCPSILSWRLTRDPFLILHRVQLGRSQSGHRRRERR